MPDIQDVTQWRVLIVDDDEDNLMLAAEFLKYAGATVQIAFNGEIGMMIAHDFAPNIILMDLSMPVMDGWRMLEALRQDEALKTIPVIALTAHAMTHDRERVETAGFDGYVTKPFMLGELVDSMKNWLVKYAEKKAAAKGDAPSTQETVSVSIDTAASKDAPVSSDATVSSDTKNSQV